MSHDASQRAFFEHLETELGLCPTSKQAERVGKPRVDFNRNSLEWECFAICAMRGR